MEIRPYTQADWPRIAAVHDAARPMELHLAGLDGAFLPRPWQPSGRGCLITPFWLL